MLLVGGAEGDEVDGASAAKGFVVELARLAESLLSFHLEKYVVCI